MGFLSIQLNDTRLEEDPELKKRLMAFTRARTDLISYIEKATLLGAQLIPEPENSVTSSAPSDPA